MSLIEKTKLLPCFTPKQVYEIEKAWFKQGNSSYGLMQQAAWSAAMHIFGQLRPKNQAIQVCVLCGTGNNGGDGWLVAKYLAQFGFEVAVVALDNPTTEDAARAKADAVDYVRLVEDLVPAQIYIDALFGIGLNRAPEGTAKSFIYQLNKLKSICGSLIVSLDTPSGLNAGTGDTYDGICVQADVTLCFVAYKLGLFVKNAKDVVGKIVYLPLLPLTHSPVTPEAFVADYAPKVPKRESNTHKGSYGHVFIVAGNIGMGGAAMLSAGGAFAMGAGKVTVACHLNYHLALLTSQPNAMLANISNPQEIKQKLPKCNTLVIGMGLGRGTDSLSILENGLQLGITHQLNIILDADALYLLPQLNKALLEKLKQNDVWYTPHSAEAAQILGISSKEVEDNRIDALKSLAQRYGGSWLLKGAGTLVFEAGQVFVCTLGNAGMATAGMGDVLSGMAAGLCAQAGLGATLLDAVLLHAQAADRAALKLGESALQAQDLLTAQDLSTNL